MFYIHGGASGKKKAVQEIFALSDDRDDISAVQEEPYDNPSGARSR